MTKDKKAMINELLERAAHAASRETNAGRERAACLIAQANAVKRDRTIPSYAL